MMRKVVFKILLCLFFLALFWISCKKSEPLNVTSRYPEAIAQDIDEEMLIQAIDSLAVIPGFKSIILGRNGIIAAEEYYNGSAPDSLHDVRSVTKSVMGVLIGIAIQEGFIDSIGQTIGKWFKGTIVDTLEKAKREITIEQLLTMSCGLEWHELDGGNSYNQWYNSGDYVNWVLNKPFIHQPGQGFNYNTGSTHLLSVILTQESGKSALDFARTHLFEPMQIFNSDWTILPNDEPYNNGGAGLKISPRTMFALGNLMLNSGEWNQVQVVPPEWVYTSTASHNTTNYMHYGSHYGYLWWVGQAHGHEHFYAMGWGGQFIVCVPDFDLVVVATCEWRGVSRTAAEQHWYDIYIIIMENILPAVE